MVIKYPCFSAMNSLVGARTLSAFSASICFLLAGLSPVAWAQSQRSAFPGRRIGGGTRGECTSRLVAHLVPADNVYAPPQGDDAVIGLILGQSPAPAPLLVSFRQPDHSSSGPASDLNLTFAPQQSSVVLISVPSSMRPLVWESSFDCTHEGGGGEFGFVVSSSPPALSLLTSSSSPADRRIAALSARLRSSCGGVIDSAELLDQSQLTDLSSHGLPVSLPIICPPVQK